MFEGFEPGSSIKNTFDEIDVERFIVSTTKSTAQFIIKLDPAVPWRSVRTLEKELNLFFMKEAGVNLVVQEKYKAEGIPTGRIFNTYRSSMFEELKDGSAVDCLLFDGVRFDEEKDAFRASFCDSAIDRIYGERLKEYIIKVFRERFDRDVRAEFDYSVEVKDSNLADLIEYDEKIRKSKEKSTQKDAGKENGKEEKTPEPKQESRTNAGKAAKPVDYAKFRKPKLPPDPNLIFGKNFDGNIVPISSVNDEIGDVIVSGKAFASEMKEIQKIGKVLFTFTLTDFTDSIRVKLFMTPESYSDFKELYKDDIFLTIKGVAKFDTFDKEIGISSVIGIKLAKDTRVKRIDDAPVKRIELHAHTKMSDMDAVTEPKDLVKRAFNWGHRAVAITDHGVVQGFTMAFHALNKKDYEKDPELLKRFEEFKIIYGCEGYIVDDCKDIAVNAEGKTVDSPAVSVSLVTDGTDAINNTITAFAAVDCSTGEAVSSESGMTLDGFLDFISGKVILTMTLDRDSAFLNEAALRLGKAFNGAFLDMDSLARVLYPNFNAYKIGAIAKEFGIKYDIKGFVNEARCIAEFYPHFKEEIAKKEITELTKLNGLGMASDKAVKTMPYHHIILLCKNDIGRINLYRLVSLSHLNFFNKRPRIPKSLLMKYREGIIVGSACEAGELFRSLVYNYSDREVERLCNFYDYYEVQPVGNNKFMIESDKYDISSEEDIRNVNRRIVELGEKHNKLVVATSDTHFLDPEDSIYRSIIMASRGFTDAEQPAPLFLRTTKEMLEEFSYLGQEKAYEVVVTNSNKIADMIEKIAPVRPDKAPPVIKDSDEILKKICYDKAHSMYGDELPPIVKDRLEHELNSIINNGFAVMYIIAQKLVWKSNEDGYLVGSRGSVGSSFVATMAGITEVNPLPPHYYCENCHYSDFDSDVVKEYQAKSGFDLPDAVCPVCGKKLIKDGNNIPFETFLGFNGDKEPDIDLNFSGEYQSKAHAYTEVIFGEGQTFRAGTVSGVADKTAYAYAYKYFEDLGIKKRKCELERLAKGCEGVKKTTGQHPGGIVVLPYGEDIYSFTPVQRPANDVNSTTVTTHFEYHSIDHNLLKLDILGHDDPTMIRMLQDLTGVDMKDIPMDDKNVVSLFSSPKALGIEPKDIEGCPTGSLGLPELGTDFVIQMLVDTKPECFSDMIRISGLSHGTDVWLNNTQELIKQGKCTLSTAVCTRDDIMIYLISKNIEPGVSFKIMESVRKGKGLSPEWEKLMLEHDVPEWYIWSCKRIKYMFPKAHACAYIMMAFRIAWFKVYRPLAYYAAYFSIRAKAMNYETMCRGEAVMLEEMAKLKKKQQSPNPEDKLSPREEDALSDMKIVLEMYRRGFNFTPIDIFKAKASRFQIVDDKLMPCLTTIDGLGDNAAVQVEEGVKKGKFLSVDDFKTRCKLSQTVCDKMDSLGLLGSLPKSNQISFDDLFGT